MKTICVLASIFWCCVHLQAQTPASVPNPKQAFEDAAKRVKALHLYPNGRVEYKVQETGVPATPYLGIIIIHHPVNNTWDDEMLNAEQFVMTYQNGKWGIRHHLIWITSENNWRTLDQLSSPVVAVLGAFGVNAYADPPWR